MIKTRRIFLGVVIAVLLVSMFKCHEDKFTGLDNHVDINMSDDRIVFSYYKDDLASIYTASIDGEDIAQLTNAKKYSHLWPIYSHDNSKLFYIKTPKNKNKMKSYISMMDIDSENKQDLIEVDGLITEIVFSNVLQRIFYLKANSYNNYSSIAAKAPHEYDIFSIDINGKNLKQHTSLSDYSITNLNITSDGEKLIFVRDTYDNGSYICSISVNGIENDLSTIPIKDYGTIKEHEIIGDMKVSCDDKYITFSAVSQNVDLYEYELYIMSVRKKAARQLTNLKRATSGITYYNNCDRLLFVQQSNWPDKPALYELYSIKTDGSKIKKVDLNMGINK